MFKYSVYRFGFNGKENDNETYGEGNAYDFGARVYDSRLGRWLSLDRRASKYPDVSAYSYGGNCPLIMIDVGGDSTVYYSEQGIKLHVSHDNLDNAIVIVTDNRLFAFQATLDKNYKKPDEQLLNESLRKMGDVYVLSSMEDFYKNAQIPAKKIGLANGSEPILWMDKLEDSKGKNVPLIPEYAAKFERKGNVLTVDKPQTDNLFNRSDPPDGKDGDIHDHPKAQKYKMYGSEWGSRNFEVEKGLSGPDEFASTYNPEVDGAFKVMIDNTNIVFSKSTQKNSSSSRNKVQINIDRNAVFKK